MRRGRFTSILLVLLVTAPLAFAQEPSEGQASDASRCEDLFWMPGIGDVCPRENGLYEMYAPDGRSLGFTHGPDPLCEDCLEADALSATGSTNVHCVAGDSGEYYVRVIYARAFDDADRYATMADTIRTIVGNANAMVDDAAIATGDRLSIRVKCASGIVVVDNVVLPTSRASATASTIINDLRNKGYTDGRQKHWVYYDDAGACACAGAGHIYDDESDSVGNLNNGNGQAMFAISFDSPSVRTMLHELGHNLGAVQDGAPRSSGAGHCTDGRDTMCYNDGGPNSGQCQPDFSCSSECSVEVFDCNKDTYCHANPAVGSYLDTHWQACHRETRFLQYADNVAPSMTSLSCTPSPSFEDEVVTCSFSANDGNLGVYYQVDWGDGAKTRVPATGMVSPGTTQTASHAFLEGDRVITVNATDSGTPQLTSPDLSVTHSVGPANIPPVASIVGCTPAAPREGEPVTCSFSSQDTHNVSYQVSWGDGTPSVRVPETGVVAPETTQSASHAFTSGGAFAFTVAATDDGRPPKTGAAVSLTLDVEEVNTAPVMSSLACAPTLLRPGETVTCSFAAHDDTSGIRFNVDWGDGTIGHFPSATTYVAPGTTVHSLSHVYNAAGEPTISVSATDNFSPPATGAALSAGIRVLSDISPPVLRVTDPRIGRAYLGCDDDFTKLTGRPLFIERGCMRATATDPSGVARVEVIRNGVLLGVDTTAPYEIEFDVPLFQQGLAYTVRATDNFGYVSTATFTADAIGG